jgi:hypothetical protein
LTTAHDLDRLILKVGGLSKELAGRQSTSKRNDKNFEEETSQAHNSSSVEKQDRAIT